jgi:hypothetical protein
MLFLVLTQISPSRLEEVEERKRRR